MRDYERGLMEELFMWSFISGLFADSIVTVFIMSLLRETKRINQPMDYDELVIQKARYYLSMRKSPAMQGQR